MKDTLKQRVHTLLRQAEPYTRTDMVYLASGGFWLFLKTGLSALIALGVSLAFANLLPPVTFGTYKYVFSIFGLLAIPTLMGMSTSVMRSVARGYDGTVAAVLKTKIMWGTLGSFASVGVALYYFLQGNLELAGAFGLVAIFLPFVDTFSIFNTILNSKQLFRASLLYELTVQAIGGAAVALTLFFTDTLFYILGVYFLINTSTRYLAFKIASKKYLRNNAIDPEAIRYGKHLSAMDVLSTIAETLDSILLWQFVGAVPLATYAFARAIPIQIGTHLKKITLLAFPKFAVRAFPTLQTSLPFKLAQMFVLLFIIVGTYIVAAPYLFPLLFPQYVDAIFYTQLYALTLLLYPKKMVGVAFNAHGDTRALYINSIATPLVRIVSALICIPSYGILGAIVSELVSQTFSLVLLITLFTRKKTA